MFCDSGYRSRIHDPFHCPVSSWRAETGSDSTSSLCTVSAQSMFGGRVKLDPM